MPIFTFFGVEKVDGEAIFQEKLVQAIALIRENNSIVARDVLNTLDSSTLTIQSFYALSRQHFMCIINDMSALNIDVPTDYPPSKEAVRTIGQYLNGIIFNSQTIYINSNRSIEAIAQTIIHEVTHFINDTLLDQEVHSEGYAKARYNDELRAFIAQRVFERNGSCLLRSDVKNIHAFVTDNYPEFADALDEPPHGYLFSTYDRPRP